MIDLSIPDPWPALVLAFGVYRLTRFIGWDDWPPIARLRARLLGESWVPESDVEVELPGKTPDSEADFVRPAYARPTLAHLFHCPFCLGWWVSLATFAAWNVSAGWTLWLVAPFALSGVVGLVARNLDP